MDMNRLILLFLSYLFCLTAEAQESEPSPFTVVEFGGEFFMPFSGGVLEQSLELSPGIARMKPLPVHRMKQKLDSCLSLISHDSLFGSMKGIKGVLTGKISPAGGGSEPFPWLPASLDVSLYATLAREGLPAWDGQADARFTIHINDPAKLVGNPVIRDIYPEPELTGTFFGRPEYRRLPLPGRAVVIKNNPFPLFEPVSREQFILELIGFFQKSIENSEKKSVNGKPAQPPPVVTPREDEMQKIREYLDGIRKYDPFLADRIGSIYRESGVLQDEKEPGDGQHGIDRQIVLNSWREAVRKLIAEMNAMSPVERKAQAWWSSTEESNVSGLTPAGFRGARPLVRLSRKLMDPTRPAGDIQLMVVEWPVNPGTLFSETSGYYLALSQLMELSRREPLWKQIFSLADP